MKVLTVVLVASLLFGCAKSDPPKEEAAGVIPEQQLQALEKAKAVEQTLLDADQKRREQADQQ